MNIQYLARDAARHLGHAIGVGLHNPIKLADIFDRSNLRDLGLEANVFPLFGGQPDAAHCFGWSDRLFMVILVRSVVTLIVMWLTLRGVSASLLVCAGRCGTFPRLCSLDRR
jgi:hypothetical protein